MTHAPWAIYNPQIHACTTPCANVCTHPHMHTHVFAQLGHVSAQDIGMGKLIWNLQAMESMPVPKGTPEVFLPLGCPAEMFLPKEDSQQEEANAEALEEAQGDQEDQGAQGPRPRRPGRPRRQTTGQEAKRPTKQKAKETKTKETKTKQKAKRPTKKEQDEQAVNKLLASPPLEGYLKARISDEVEKQMNSAKLDRVYEKADK